MKPSRSILSPPWPSARDIPQKSAEIGKSQGVAGDAFTLHARLRRVVQYVDEHCSQPISLDQAARVAALERSYFSTFFRTKTGIRFRDWLRQYRIARAIELMRTRNLPISRVAEAVGFRDLRTFERAFKRCVGATPSAFKKAIEPPPA